MAAARSSWCTTRQDRCWLRKRRRTRDLATLAPGGSRPNRRTGQRSAAWGPHVGTHTPASLSQIEGPGIAAQSEGFLQESCSTHVCAVRSQTVPASGQSMFARQGSPDGWPASSGPASPASLRSTRAPLSASTIPASADLSQSAWTWSGRHDASTTIAARPISSLAPLDRRARVGLSRRRRATVWGLRHAVVISSDRFPDRESARRRYPRNRAERGPAPKSRRHLPPYKRAVLHRDSPRRFLRPGRRTNRPLPNTQSADTGYMSCNTTRPDSRHSMCTFAHTYRGCRRRPNSIVLATHMLNRLVRRCQRRARPRRRHRHLHRAPRRARPRRRHRYLHQRVLRRAGQHRPLRRRLHRALRRRPRRRHRQRQTRRCRSRNPLAPVRFWHAKSAMMAKSERRFICGPTKTGALERCVRTP